MHELSLCETILSILDDSAQKEQFSRVLSIHLLLGDLSCVEPQALRFCFDAIKSGTIAQQASLIIEHVPGRARCKACGRDVVIQSYIDNCSFCQHIDLDVVDGDQMQIKFLEVC
jgi:hydrogenase nickel incorporation protein HypA/HybF